MCICIYIYMCMYDLFIYLAIDSCNFSYPMTCLFNIQLFRKLFTYSSLFVAKRLVLSMNVS